MNGIGFPPFFVEKPNGEFAGFELDTLRIMANNVNATLAFQKADIWFDYKYDDNGTIVTDDTGMPVFLGPNAEMYYKRATFAIAENYFLEDLFFMGDFMPFALMAVCFRSPKPQVLAPTWNLIKPFSLSVWLAVSIGLLIIMVFYALFVHMYGSVHKENYKSSWLENAIAIYMHQLSQGISTLGMGGFRASFTTRVLIIPGYLAQIPGRAA